MNNRNTPTPPWREEKWLENKQAVKFAEANRQEQKWLRDEIKELKMIIAALLTKTADCATISESTMRDVKDNCEFSMEYDHRNMVYKLTYRDKYDKVTAVQKNL